MTRNKQRFAVEHCWTLVGRRQGRFWLARRMRRCRGEVAHVAFDAAWALAREEARGDVVGFYHTHPCGPAQTSQRDVHTMQGWVSAFGKPLLCLIESPDGLGAFRFDDDELPGVPLDACELFPAGIVVVLDNRE
jgi:proteasome lid subunit RPN8/RPN11